MIDKTQNVLVAIGCLSILVLGRYSHFFVPARSIAATLLLIAAAEALLRVDGSFPYIGRSAPKADVISILTALWLGALAVILSDLPKRGARASSTAAQSERQS